MTQDPIRPLADIGRRALQTVRYLATPPVPDQHLGSYENQLRDPVLALSGLCNELLERLIPAPAEAEPENLAGEAGSRFVPAPIPGSALPPSSRSGARETRISADGRNEPAGAQRENQGTQRADTSGFDEASPFEWHRRPIDDPAALSQDEPGGAILRTGSPAPTPGSAIDGSDRYPAAGSRNVQQHPVRPDGGSSQEERSIETVPPIRQDRPEIRQAELPLEALPSDLPARAENGSVRGAGERSVPPPSSRLTGSAEGLAAILRSHVAQPEPPFAGEAERQESEELLSSRQEGDEDGTVDEPVRTRPPAGRAGIEEIMERLAEELETEFVRTYGRSGG